LPEVLRGAQAYQEIIYGGLLIGFVVFLPQGIAGLMKRWGLLPREILVRGWRRHAREHAASLAPGASMAKPGLAAVAEKGGAP
jgi:hypothetical protein